MNRKNLKKEVIAIMLVSVLFSGNTVKPVYCEDVCEKEVTDSISSRANKHVWYYKEEDGKKYMRLYDATNEIWLTDWILCE